MLSSRQRSGKARSFTTVMRITLGRYLLGTSGMLAADLFSVSILPWMLSCLYRGSLRSLKVGFLRYRVHTQNHNVPAPGVSCRRAHETFNFVADKGDPAWLLEAPRIILSQAYGSRRRIHACMSGPHSSLWWAAPMLYQPVIYSTAQRKSVQTSKDAPLFQGRKTLGWKAPGFAIRTHSPHQTCRCSSAKMRESFRSQRPGRHL